MNADVLHIAIASRAAGEEMPGLDAALLDRRIHDDPALGAELAELEGVVALLRRASVPAAAARLDAVRERLLRTRLLRGRRVRRGAVAAAAVLLVAAGAGIFLRSRTPEVSTSAGTRESAFAEAFRNLSVAAPLLERPPVPGSFAGPPVRGDPPAAAGLLGPFAAQADFVLYAPPQSPSTEPPVAARFRRAGPDGRAFSMAWLEYTSPGGPIVIAQSGDSPAAEVALQSLALSPGWRFVVRRASGVILLVAARHLGEGELQAIADELVPVLR